MAVQIRSPTHLSKILSPTFIRLYDLHLNRKSCGWCTEAEFFLLPQPQMCYVPTKGEGETNVSSKFVDDSSAVYKTGEMHQVLQFWAMRQTWATDGDLGTENIKMIVDILQVNEITQKTMQNEKKNGQPEGLGNAKIQDGRQKVATEKIVSQKPKEKKKLEKVFNRVKCWQSGNQ